jgi:hypothetical protein
MISCFESQINKSPIEEKRKLDLQLTLAWDYIPMSIWDNLGDFLAHEHSNK